MARISGSGLLVCLMSDKGFQFGKPERQTEEERLKREMSWSDTLSSLWFKGWRQGRGLTLWPSCSCAILCLCGDYLTRSTRDESSRSSGTTLEAAISMPCSREKSLYFTQSWEKCQKSHLLTVCKVTFPVVHHEALIARTADKGICSWLAEKIFKKPARLHGWGKKKKFDQHWDHNY